MSKEKVMIVVWKWRQFEREAKVVNTSLLEKAGFVDAITEPAGYKNVLFDEFVVCEKRPDGTALAANPSAKVVRTFVENEVRDLSSSTFNFLENLIKLYKDDKAEVFVFLHRRDGFGEKEVEYIKQANLADRCFLMGDGLDAIYYSQEYDRGLLSDNGRFYRSESRPGSPPVSIANEKEKTIDLRCFTKVWSYYKHEFHSKIFELREDLLTHFYAIYPDKLEWSFERRREHLYENTTLKLRVASFIGDDKISLTQNQLNLLDREAKENKRSYAFDDLKANLKNHKVVYDDYKSTVELLYEYFFDEKTTDVAHNLNQMLRTIEQKFTHLLQAIKPT